MAKKKRGGRSAAFMRSINPYLKKRRSSSTKLKSYKTMAKKRRSGSKKRSGSMMGVNTSMAIAAILYGAARQKVSNFVAPYTAKIPLGSISDEAGMLIGTTLAKKFLVKKSGVLRDALTAGQTIELARIGEAIINGEVSLGSLGGNAQAADNGYTFA